MTKSNFGTDWGKLGSNVYSGTAEVGKDLAIIGTVIACIFSFFLFIFGIFMIFRKPQYTLTATMTMDKTSGPDINGYFQNKGTITSGSQCIGRILNLVNSGMNMYNQGDQHQVFLKPDSCNDAQLHKDNTKWIGVFFIIISLLIIASSFIKLFFVKKYKGVAAASGVFDVFNLFKR